MRAAGRLCAGHGRRDGWEGQAAQGDRQERAAGKAVEGTAGRAPRAQVQVRVITIQFISTIFLLQFYKIDTMN